MKFTSIITLATLALTVTLAGTAAGEGAATSNPGGPSAATVRVAGNQLAGARHVSSRAAQGHVRAHSPTPPPGETPAGWQPGPRVDTFLLRPFLRMTSCQLRARLDGSTSLVDVAKQQGHTGAELTSYVAKRIRQMTSHGSGPGLPRSWGAARLAEFKRYSRLDVPALGRCAAPAGVAEAEDLSQVELNGRRDEDIVFHAYGLMLSSF